MFDVQYSCSLVSSRDAVISGRQIRLMSSCGLGLIKEATRRSMAPEENTSFFRHRGIDGHLSFTLSEVFSYMTLIGLGPPQRLDDEQ